MRHHELIIFRQTSLQCHALRVLAIALVRLVRPGEEEPGGSHRKDTHRGSALSVKPVSEPTTCTRHGSLDSTTACTDANTGAASGQRAPILRPASAPSRSLPSDPPTHRAERAPQSSGQHGHGDRRDRAGTSAKGPLSAPQAAASAPRLEQSSGLLGSACSPVGLA